MCRLKLRGGATAQRYGSEMGVFGGMREACSVRSEGGACARARVRVCRRDNVSISEVSWEDAIAKPFTNALHSSTTHTHSSLSSNHTHVLAAPPFACHTLNQIFCGQKAI